MIEWRDFQPVVKFLERECFSYIKISFELLLYDKCMYLKWTQRKNYICLYEASFLIWFSLCYTDQLVTVLNNIFLFFFYSFLKDSSFLSDNAFLINGYNMVYGLDTSKCFQLCLESPGKGFFHIQLQEYLE
jgi:hypothetical protein